MFHLPHPPTPTLPRKEGGSYGCGELALLYWAGGGLLLGEYSLLFLKTASATGIDVREYNFNGSAHASPRSLRGWVRVGGSQLLLQRMRGFYATILPMLSKSYGGAFVTNKSMGLSFAGKLPWRPISLISIVLAPISLLSWMAGNMRKTLTMMRSVRLGLMAEVIGSFDFGTMRFMKILRVCWNVFARNCINLVVRTPHPNPPPQGGREYTKFSVTSVSSVVSNHA